MLFPVRVFVGPTNSDPFFHIDQARRLLDVMKGADFRRKSKQTNERFESKGYLRFVFPSRRLAKRYQALVEQFCSSCVSTKRYKR